MRFSASMLKTWGLCSLKAKFNYLDKLPTKTGSSAHMGSCVHAGCEALHKGKTLAQALDVFVKEYNAVVPDYFNRRTDYDGLRIKGIEMIQNYAEALEWKKDHNFIAAEHPFMVNIGEHTLSGIVDYIEVPPQANKLIIGDLKTGYRPNKDTLHLDLQFCADIETQTLTKRGWKAFSELVVGEDILTYNQEFDLAEWQPVLSLHDFEAKDQELISIEGRGHSSLTTKNHRWLVNHRLTKRGSDDDIQKRVVVSDELTGSDSIPCARPLANLPEEAKYEDAFVELVGWYWTEGHMVKGGSLSLAQQSGSHFDRICDAAQTLWGNPVGSLRNGKQSLPNPTYRISYSDDANRLYFNRVASQELYAAFSDVKLKVLDPQWLTSLTEDQLKLLVDVSIWADGHERDGCRVIEQSSRERLDAFAIACQLLGIRTTLTSRRLGGNGPYSDHVMYKLSLKERMSNFVPATRKKKVVNYTGTVWCPRTANGSWLARREGTVYFTGNTAYDWASRQKEFWTGHPSDLDKYPPIPGGEELYEEFKDLERELVWYDLKKQEEINVGARTDRDYGRMYRCMEMIERAIDHEVFVPSVSAEGCFFCDFKDVCPVYFAPEVDDHAE